MCRFRSRSRKFIRSSSKKLIRSRRGWLIITRSRSK